MTGTRPLHKQSKMTKQKKTKENHQAEQNRRQEMQPADKLV
jgi:hypothetical protein